MDELVVLGKIGRPHGNKGEVRLFLANPTSESLSKDMEVVLLRDGKELARHTLEEIRYVPKFAILKFKGLTFRDQVDLFKHAELAMDAALLPELGEEEFYHRDLLDLPVFVALEEDGEDFDEKQPFGTVSRVFETGANDVLVVKRADGSDFLVPLIEEAISFIDLEEEVLVLQPLEIWAPED